MENQTFEEWLEEGFIKIGEVNGTPITKDNCEGLFDTWLSNFEGDDYLKFGNLYGKQKYSAGKIEVLEKQIESLNQK